MFSIRSFLQTSVFAAVVLPAGAQAASLTATPVSVPVAATARYVPSLKALATSPANFAALRAAVAHPIEMPRHRYPDGSILRIPSQLPRAITPNANVVEAISNPPTSVTGFTGLYEGANLAATGGELEPPDQGLAVYANQVFEIINNSLEIFSANGSVLAGPVANTTFFNNNAGYTLSDPHVIYDPTTQRWFVEELAFSSSFTGFYVAVSQTSNPAGAYYLYTISGATSQISACGTALCLPDYPQVGFDKNGFYIAADLFSNATGNFVETAFYCLPKLLMESGSSINYVFFGMPDFVVQPAIPAPGQAFLGAAGGTELAMTARNIDDGSTNVRVWAISNTNLLPTSPTSLRAYGVDVAAEAYGGTVPSTEPNHVGPYGKSIGATQSPKLAGGYNAFGGGVKYAAGTLYGALATGTTDGNGLARDVIAYFAVKPTVSSTGMVSASIAAQGYVVPGNGYSISYPDLALDKTGTGLIGMSICHNTTGVPGAYPSTAFVEFTGNAPTGAIIIKGKGNTADDGFTGYGSTGIGRWGDYGGATQDAKTKHYWTANEFIPNATKFPRGTYANWGTFITQAH